MYKKHPKTDVTAVKDCPNDVLALLGRVATTVSLSTSADTAVPKHHYCFQALGTLANHTTKRQAHDEQHKIQNTSKNALDMRPFNVFVVKKPIDQ